MKKVIIIFALCFLCFLFAGCHKTEPPEIKTETAENLTDLNWREIYAGYLNNILGDIIQSDFYPFGFSTGFYIGEINNDGIPELVINYGGFTILYFIDAELKVLELKAGSTWDNAVYAEETNQIIFSRGYFGDGGIGWDYFIYDWTPGGYIETCSLTKKDVDYEEEDEETGEIYIILEELYINGEKAGYYEFESALEEINALLNKSISFEMINIDEIEDYFDYFNLIEI